MGGSLFCCSQAGAKEEKKPKKVNTKKEQMEKRMDQ